MEHDFFKKYGPGTDVESVTFIPKTSSNKDFSFTHRFLPELIGYTEDEKMSQDSFKDALRFVDTHFTPRVYLLTKIDGQQEKDITQSDPIGFQMLWVKGKYPFNVLNSMKLRGNVNGNLTVYVFEGNGKLREVETIKNIKTEGETMISLKDFNLNLTLKAREAC